jgi:hypothetical protein
MLPESDDLQQRIMMMDLSIRSPVVKDSGGRVLIRVIEIDSINENGKSYAMNNKRYNTTGFGSVMMSIRCCCSRDSIQQKEALSR